MFRLIVIADIVLVVLLAGCTSWPQMDRGVKASTSGLAGRDSKEDAPPHPRELRQDLPPVALPVCNYQLQQTISVPGEGGWDLLAVDEAARRVYVSHSTQVDVIDADAGKWVGTIPNTPGVHGIAVAPDLVRGFISNGKADTVTVFDLKTLRHVAEVRVGKHPDCVVYEPVTHRAIVFNGGSANASIIDATSNQVVATVALGGRPEFAVADYTGQVFVVLENLSELVKLDVNTSSVKERWPLSPGQGPASLAMDRNNHRLFVGCRNKLLVVVNADTGSVVATLPVGERVDATAYDPETRLVFSANGEGTVTVVRQEGPNQYVVVQTVPTSVGSKTLALDGQTHRLFIPAVQGPQTTTVTAPHSGSLGVLVFGQ